MNVKLKLRNENIAVFNASTSRGVYYTFRKGEVLDVKEEDAKDLLQRYKVLQEVKENDKDKKKEEDKSKKDKSKDKKKK